MCWSRLTLLEAVAPSQCPRGSDIDQLSLSRTPLRLQASRPEVKARPIHGRATRIRLRREATAAFVAEVAKGGTASCYIGRQNAFKRNLDAFATTAEAASLLQSQDGLEIPSLPRHACQPLGTHSESRCSVDENARKNDAAGH